MLEHRCIAAALLALALAGCQGRGLQPQSTSAATPQTNDTMLTVTSLPVTTEPQSSTTVETTSTTAEIIPETVPVTSLRATVPATTARTTAPVTAEATSTGGACGGSLPPCWVMMRESGGDPTVWNAQGSGASGKWQFMPGTWAGYGGYTHAAYAPESVQDAKARIVWDGGAGCQHWSAC